jgi:hypothetical protein
VRYYYNATLCGFRLEGHTDAGILQEANGMAHARTLAEEEVLTKYPNATILSLEVREAGSKEVPCEL